MRKPQYTQILIMCSNLTLSLSYITYKTFKLTHHFIYICIINSIGLRSNWQNWWTRVEREKKHRATAINLKLFDWSLFIERNFSYFSNIFFPVQWLKEFCVDLKNLKYEEKQPLFFNQFNQKNNKIIWKLYNFHLINNFFIIFLSLNFIKKSFIFLYIFWVVVRRDVSVCVCMCVFVYFDIYKMISILGTFLHYIFILNLWVFLLDFILYVKYIYFHLLLLQISQ